MAPKLSALTKSQVEMDKIRAEEKALLKTFSAGTEQMLEGVKTACIQGLERVLR